MKKTIFFIIAYLFTTLAVSGQVFILDSWENTMLFGPENISNNQLELAEMYVTELKEIKLEMQEWKQEILDFVERRKKKLNSNWTKRTKGEKTLELLPELEKDILVVDSLITLWNEVALQKELLLKLPVLIKAGQCVELITEEGVFNQNEVLLTITTTSQEIMYSEFFFTNPQGSYFRSIPSNSGVPSYDSGNNSDVQVCLVMIKGYYIFIDASGTKQKLKTLPEEFDFDIDYLFAFNEKFYDVPRKTVVITTKDTHKKLSLLKFRMVACDK